MDSIGVQGGSIPGLAPGGMVPTIQLGDLSRNFAAEVFERRAVVGVTLHAVLARGVGALQVQSKAPGGIVVEQIKGTTEPGSFLGWDGWRILIAPNPQTLIGALVHFWDPLKVGGGVPGSSVELGQLDEGWFATPASPTQFMKNPWELAPTQLWVPPGHFMTVANGSYNLSTGSIFSYLQLVFREIPEIQGVPE